MRRRQFLASGTALLSVAIAGCGHPPVVLDMDEATADDIADEVSMAIDPDSEEYSVISSALENGSATRSGRNELFDRTDTVRFENTFHEVSETRVGSREVTVYEVQVDFNPDNSTSNIGEIDYEDLPEVDRERLERFLSEDKRPETDGYDIGVSYGTAEESGTESVFVPDQQYDIIVHEGNRYRVAVDPRTTSEVTYRYELTEVAPDVESFADQVRDRYLFSLTDLSDAERDVVEEAIEDGYFEDDDNFRSVVEQIRNHEGIEETDSYGTWLLEYDGVEYLVYAEW